MNKITPYSNVKIDIKSAIKHLVKSYASAAITFAMALIIRRCNSRVSCRGTKEHLNKRELCTLELPGEVTATTKTLRTCNPRSSYRDLKSIVSRNFTFFVEKPPKMCSSLEQH